MAPTRLTLLNAGASAGVREDGGVTASGTALHTARLRVSWFELFYDLVVTTVMVSLNDSFLQHPGLGNGLLVGFAAVALMNLWLLTTLAVNRMPGDTSIRRILLLLQMACVAVIALAIDQVQGLPNHHGFLAYGVALLCVAGLYLSAPAAVRPPSAANRVALIALASAAVIAFSGALLPDAVGWIVVALTLLVSLVPMQTRYASLVTATNPVEPAHLGERLGLLVIMAIGLTFGELVVTLSGLGTVPDLRFFIVTFTMMFVIWWLYFGLGVPESSQPIPAMPKSRVVAHFLIIIGIVGMGDVYAALSAARSNTPLVDGAWYLGAMALATLTGLAVLMRGTGSSDRMRFRILLSVGLVVGGVAVAADAADAPDLRFMALAVALILAITAATLHAIARGRLSPGRAPTPGR